LQVTAADFTGKKEIVRLERRKLDNNELEISFEFRKQRFEYDEATNTFDKLAYPVQVLRCRPPQANLPTLVLCNATTFHVGIVPSTPGVCRRLSGPIRRAAVMGTR
jgi:hypothetical protein